jgi:hypothetical protein
MASRFLSHNAGIPLTDGPAFFNVAECLHEKTHLYVNAFLLVPLKNVHNGKEADPRVGYRLGPEEALFGWLEFDGSLALYASTSKEKHRVKDFYTVDVRTELGHTFTISPVVKLRLYGTLDYQRLLAEHSDIFKVGIGTSFDVDLPSMTFGIEAETWKDLITPEPERGLIGSIAVSAGYKVPDTKVIIGPRVHFTSDPTGKQWLMGGMFLYVTF